MIDIKTKMPLPTANFAGHIVLIKTVVVVLLMIWIAFSLSTFILRLLPQPKLQVMDVSSNSQAFTPKQSSQLPAVDVAALKKIALFGDEKVAPPPPVQEVVRPIQKEVEATSLNLELVGSFANNNQDKAYAIIAKGNKQELYKVNEEVAGLSNVKLIQVYADRVILDNRGRQEALLMYPEGKPISSSSSSSGPTQLEIESRVSLGGSSSGLANLKPQQRLEKISDAIRFSRKTKDGKMLGFRVLPGRNRDAFEQTGLKLNDVVTAIDGQVLDNLKAANQIYQQKRNATQASLTVLRGEEELTIDIDLNNININ